MSETRTFEDLGVLVRASAPLHERIQSCTKRICKMCGDGRPPTMSVPVRYDDDDVFIIGTLGDCETLRASVEPLRVAAGRMVRATTPEEKLAASVEVAHALNAAFGKDGW